MFIFIKSLKILGLLFQEFEKRKKKRSKVKSPNNFGEFMEISKIREKNLLV
jgi:hypothetical protein